MASGILLTKSIVVWAFKTSDYEDNDPNEITPEDPISGSVKADVSIKRVQSIPELIELLSGGKPSGRSLDFLKEVSTLEAFKENLSKKQEECMGSEDFLAVNRITQVMNTCDDWFDNRKAWFISMVGSTIQPDYMNCDCEDCNKARNEGVFVKDQKEALSLFMQECASKIEERSTTYKKK